MLFKTNTSFKIEDFCETKDGIYIESNLKPNLNILNDSQTLKVIPRIKTAKVVKVAPRENDFLYIRNRAVSAGNCIDQKDGSATLVPMDEYLKFFEKYAKICRNANDNGDFFSHEELEKSYLTFIGKAAFVDHDNENIEKARGIILDAVYNRRGLYVELLKAVDKIAYPELARGIAQGYMDSTSMGCRVSHSVCSICQNSAAVEDEFCEHVLNYKGSTFNGLPVFEINNGIEFFEDSFVACPADKYAKILEKVASKQNRSSSQTIIPQIKKINEGAAKIINETNQRTRDGRINTFADKLKGLDWS